jgi:Protein of unknown function (DUF2490)
LRKILFLIISFLLQAKVFSQTAPMKSYANNSNVWVSYSGDYKLSEKWGFHLDGSWRKNEFFLKPQQSIIRTGINYYFNAQVFASAGYCYVENAPYGGFPAKASFSENRIWEQIQIKSQLQHFEWVSRFRLEQRFSKTPILNSDNVYAAGPAVYTNRFRLQNRFSIPLKGKTIVDKSYYLSAFNEVMVNFGKNVAANILDQNRVYFAIGNKIPKLGRLEIAYLLQSVYKPDGYKIERNHTLQIGLSSSLDLYKKK